MHDGRSLGRDWHSARQDEGDDEGDDAKEQPENNSWSRPLAFLVRDETTDDGAHHRHDGGNRPEGVLGS
jgi:hypothetical protein